MLAALLCFVLTLSITGKAEAAHATACKEIVLADIDGADETSSVISAAETAPGEPEGILQLNKALVVPLFHAALAQLYPPQHISNNRPGVYPFSGSDCGKHSSLSKGP